MVHYVYNKGGRIVEDQKNKTNVKRTSFDAVI